MYLFAPEDPDAIAEVFRKERDGKHGAVIQASLEILRKPFALDDKTEGLSQGRPSFWPSSNLARTKKPREARALRQRQPSGVIDQLVARIG